VTRVLDELEAQRLLWSNSATKDQCLAEVEPGMSLWCPNFTVLWDHVTERTIASWDTTLGPTQADIIAMATELTREELCEVLAAA